jgi:branched-chain amino acid transport system substrate-binding protein
MKRVRISGLFLIVLLSCTGIFLNLPPEVSAQDGGLIKVGALLPLSGGAASWGIPSLRSMELMAEKINSEGGVKLPGTKMRMELVKADTKGTADAALAQANKLIFEDKVKFICGPIITSAVLAVLPVTEANKVILMSYAASPKVIGADKPYAFRLYPSVRESTIGIFEYLKKSRPDIKTLGLVGPNDDSGWDNSKLIKAMAKDYGIEVTFEDFVQRGTTDFFPVLTKMVAKNPNAVMYHAMPGGMTALLIQQGHQLGFKGLVLIPSHQDPDLLVGKAGLEATEGCILPTPDFAAGTPWMQEAYKRYQEKYKEKFDPIVNVGYPMLWILKLAIEKAGTIDTTEVAKAMENLEGEMPYGKFSMGGLKTYGSRHQIIYPVFLSQIKGGKLTNIGTVMPPTP